MANRKRKFVHLGLLYEPERISNVLERLRSEASAPQPPLPIGPFCKGKRMISKCPKRKVQHAKVTLLT